MSKICFDWEKGACDRGNSCKFSHDTGKQSVKKDIMDVTKNPVTPKSVKPVSSSNDDAVVENATEAKGSKETKKQRCFRFAKSQSCKFGDECKFVHVMKEKNSVAENPVTPKSVKPVSSSNDDAVVENATEATGSKETKKQRCFKFAKSQNCKFGDECKFVHVLKEKLVNTELMQ